MGSLWLVAGSLWVLAGLPLLLASQPTWVRIAARCLATPAWWLLLGGLAMLSVVEVLALLVTSKPGDTYTGVYDDRALASELLQFILVWGTAALALTVARYRRRRVVAAPTPFEAERSTL